MRLQPVHTLDPEGKADGSVPVVSGGRFIVGTAPSDGGGGTTTIRYASINKSDGNVAFTGPVSGWKDVSTALDMTIPAAAGDLLEVGMAIRVRGSAWCVLDLHTLVGGAPVRSVGQESAATVASSHAGWQSAAVTAGGVPFTGTKFYTVQASDVDAGNVVLRLRGRAPSGTTQTLDGVDPYLFLEVANFGPRA